jgi:hypothetical protein
MAKKETPAGAPYPRDSASNAVAGGTQGREFLASIVDGDLTIRAFQPKFPLDPFSFPFSIPKQARTH